MKIIKAKEQNAYAFFDYEGTEKSLKHLLERTRARGNFDDLKLTILNQEEKDNLPQKLIAEAKMTDACARLSGDYSQAEFHKLRTTELKTAYELPYLVLGMAPRELGESTSETAGMLDHILGQISSIESQKKVFLGVVLFPNSRGNYLKY